MERSRFEALVVEVIAQLPEEFQARLANLEVVVEDRPRANDRTVLALYHGVPLCRRGAFYGNVLPDRIVIYQKVIEKLCRDEAELPELVRRVVLHEIGHYFGLSEAQLQALNY